MAGDIDPRTSPAQRADRRRTDLYHEWKIARVENARALERELRKTAHELIHLQPLTQERLARSHALDTVARMTRRRWGIAWTPLD